MTIQKYILMTTCSSVSTPDSAIASFSTGEFSKKGTGSPDVSLLDELVEAKYYGVDEVNL